MDFTFLLYIATYTRPLISVQTASYQADLRSVIMLRVRHKPLTFGSVIKYNRQDATADIGACEVIQSACITTSARRNTPLRTDKFCGSLENCCASASDPKDQLRRNLVNCELPDGGSPDVSTNENLSSTANQPEMLYLETKVGILDPFARGGGFAEGSDLPVGDLVNARAVRNHLQHGRQNASSRSLGRGASNSIQFEGSDRKWERQPLP